MFFPRPLHKLKLAAWFPSPEEGKETLTELEGKEGRSDIPAVSPKQKCVPYFLTGSLRILSERTLGGYHPTLKIKFTFFINKKKERIKRAA